MASPSQFAAGREQAADTNADKVLQQYGSEDDMEGDDKAARKQFWTSIAINVAKIIGIFAALVALLLIPTVVFRWLWNITMPDVFNLKPITFWQCFRLLLMVFLLGVVSGGLEPYAFSLE